MSTSQEDIKRVWNGMAWADAKLAPHEQAVFEKLLSVARGAANILEVGAGDGRMIKVLRSHGVAGKVHALDLVDSDTPGAIKSIGDARSMPYASESFDLVYSLGVVEHFPETELAILEHARVCRPGGHVMITVPHLSIPSMMRYWSYFNSGAYRKGSFELVRGRGISFRAMEAHCRAAGLAILDMDGGAPSGLLAESIGIKRALKEFVYKLPFRAPFLPYLYCWTVKK